MENVNRNEFLRDVRNDAKLNGLSELMDGRSKMSTDDILGQELTIEVVDVIDFTDTDGSTVHYGVIVTAEYPDKFLNCGKSLTAICESITSRALKATGGDIEGAKSLVAEMKIKFTAEKVQTKGKRTFTRISLI